MSVVHREPPASILRTDSALPELGSPDLSSSDNATDVRVAPNRMKKLGARVGWSAVMLALLAGGGYVAAKYAGLFADKAIADRQTHTVTRGDLIVRISEDGNLESSSNTEIRCLVAGGSTIKWIVPDGKFVEYNEKLVELNSAPIDEQILTQQIAYERARALRDQVVNDHEAAKISLDEYVKGTFKKDLQTAQSLLAVAEENLRSAKNTLEFTERMYRKAYVTKLQFEAQKFAVTKAELDVASATTAKEVLETFTFKKMKNDLEVLVKSTDAKAKSEQAAFALEESKLERLKTQKANCIIKAPQAGMVVYANDSSSWFGGNDRPKIEEGAAVRESQVMLYVPDLKNMQVKVNVHESKVDSLKQFMAASIRIQNRKFTGYVTAIANQPETASRYASGVKTYATMVKIDGSQVGLKPGMTAKVDILVEERKNVLTAPVQCVVEQLGKSYCWKVVGDEIVKTEVKIKPGDDRSVEIVSGLEENDVVLHNPPERAEGPQAGDRREFGSGRRGQRGAGATDENKTDDPTPNGSQPAGPSAQDGARPEVIAGGSTTGDETTTAGAAQPSGTAPQSPEAVGTPATGGFEGQQ